MYASRGLGGLSCEAWLVSPTTWNPVGRCHILARIAHECGRDGGPPCFGLAACYGHVKARYGHMKKVAMNGGRDRLTDEGLRRRGHIESASLRWLASAERPGRPDRPSAEDSAMLAALMDADDADSERLRFGSSDRRCGSRMSNRFSALAACRSAHPCVKAMAPSM